MKPQPLYRELARLVDAYHRCVANGNQFGSAHKERIRSLVRECMPSGSGFDNGTTIDLAASSGEKLVFRTSYHHMNSNGFYEGWTEHVVTVKPSLLHGFTIAIGGRDRNDTKEYIQEAFYHPLGSDAPADKTLAVASFRGDNGEELEYLPKLAEGSIK